MPKFGLICLREWREEEEPARLEGALGRALEDWLVRIAWMGITPAVFIVTLGGPLEFSDNGM